MIAIGTLLAETARAVVELADAGFPWLTCAQYEAAVAYCAAHGDPFLLDRAEGDPEAQQALYRALVTSAQAYIDGAQACAPLQEIDSIDREIEDLSRIRRRRTPDGQRAAALRRVRVAAARHRRSDLEDLVLALYGYTVPAPAEI